MRFSVDWLGDYVELPASAEELGERLTFAGLAVDYIEPAGDDTVLDIDVTTNRPDAMCHLGVAREISALYDRPLALPFPDEEAPVADRVAGVAVVLDDERCPRYVARVIRGIRVGESPDWLKKRLEAIGARPINNVVDVTNYVLWETGQPLHAFDLAKIRGGRIEVRAAREGEGLTTLDGERRELDPEVLVIADAEGATALAGVMGGLDSEVTESTVDVLLESAHFDPKAVRRGARRLGMHTDASHRFERGADPGACAAAAARAAHLMAEIAGGTVLPETVDARFDAERDWTLSGRLDGERLDAFAGIAIDPERVESWMERLGFGLEQVAPSVWQVQVPSQRFYDFSQVAPDGSVYEQDLFEEVVRLHGFDAIPSTLPSAAGPDRPPTEMQRARRRIRRLLAAAGYAEAITYAFVSQEEDDRFAAYGGEGPALRLANPLSERYAVMRRTLAAGLVESARFNQRRQAESVRLFELGRVFYPRPEDAVSGSGDGSGPLPRELEALSIVAGGTVGSPWQRSAELDLFDVKGAVEAVAELLGVDLLARPAEVAGLEPGASAELVLARPAGGDRPVGFLGRVRGDDPYPLFIAEVALDELVGGEESRPVDAPSRFPGIAVDLTFTHPLAVAWTEIERLIGELAPPDLASWSLRDRYRGEGVAEGQVNTTISFFYNSAERSLTQAEVNERHEALAAELARRFSGDG